MMSIISLFGNGKKEQSHSKARFVNRNKVDVNKVPRMTNFYLVGAISLACFNKHIIWSRGGVWFVSTKKDLHCFWCEQGQSSAIVAVVFDPDDSKTLVTCGKEHIYFWRLHNTRLERKNGYFEVCWTVWFYICVYSVTCIM